MAGCSDAECSSSCDPSRDLGRRSACDVTLHSAGDVECPGEKHQCGADTIYQSVYVMSDQKDECVIATEVSEDPAPYRGLGWASVPL